MRGGRYSFSRLGGVVGGGGGRGGQGGTRERESDSAETDDLSTGGGAVDMPAVAARMSK